MFHQIDILILNKSIYYIFIAKVNMIKTKLREKIQKYYFLILYNNMNFYKYMRDT